MLLRCRLDGLLLPAWFLADGRLRLADGDEEFTLESIEATYYDVVEASDADWRRASRRYRLLRRANTSLRILRDYDENDLHFPPRDVYHGDYCS